MNLVHLIGELVLDRHFFKDFLRTRNLNTLRDIHRIIQEGRRSEKGAIVFQDVEGTRWLLKQIPTRARNEPQKARQFV